jgi:hypothetical protein
MQGPTKPWDAAREHLDTGTAAGECFLDTLGVFAEFETNLRRERQLEGIAMAKAAGVYKGRPACLVPAPKGHCSHCCCVDQPVSVVLDLMHPTRCGGSFSAVHLWRSPPARGLRQLGCLPGYWRD